MQLDLGIKKGGSSEGYGDENYTVYFLGGKGDNLIKAKEEITGKIYIGEMKPKQFKKQETHQFYVIITDDENEKKWIAGLTATYNTKKEDFYCEIGGRVYIFVDSIVCASNGTERNEEDNYNIDFNTFRDTINENVEQVTVRAVKSLNPKAKAPNIEVVKVVLEGGETPPASASLDLKKLEKITPLRQAIETIRMKKEDNDITVEDIEEELVLMKSEVTISNDEFDKCIAMLK